MAETAAPTAVKLYDGLFLMSQAASTDINASLNRIREILEYRGAEVLSLRKWDERRLAYAVQGQKRGTYILALFRVAGSQVAVIERDCELSDDVMRVLVTRGDHIGEIEIQQEIEAGKVSRDEAKLREGQSADEDADEADEEDIDDEDDAEV
jgi:small subunit ribosomal protein S6